MNYRHIYHAGNFADVLKHIVLLLCLDYLQRKKTPFCVIDTHGGAGLYDLSSSEAQKTGEFRKGISLLRPLENPPADVGLYLDSIAPDLNVNHYPGSPLLIARNLRAQDRYIAAELHPSTYTFLCKTMAEYPRVRVVEMDGYVCIRAHTPPPERRGLVFVDPPYEKKDEMHSLQKHMQEWKKRWPTGIYLVWYPIKMHLPVEELKQAAQQLGLHRTWSVELLVSRRDIPNTLNGCGMLLFNAPYTIPERVASLLPVLKNAMSLHAFRTDWLVGENEDNHA